MSDFRAKFAQGRWWKQTVSGGDRSHWFEALADHMGSAYLRYSFTRGTEQEVGFLVDVLGLEPGMRVLDVGCGPGRHAHALGRRGIEVHGVDISERFVEVARGDAPPGVTFARADARTMDFREEFDAAISLCQGAFGLQGTTGDDDRGEDDTVLARIARAVRPGGAVGVSAFSAYHQLRYLPGATSFDAAAGVAHERTTIKDEDGRDAEVDLWTTCFTPRELRLLASAAGLEVDAIWSVTPGDYARNEPDIEQPEHLLVAHRPDHR